MQAVAVTATVSIILEHRQEPAHRWCSDSRAQSKQAAGKMGICVSQKTPRTGKPRSNT